MAEENKKKNQNKKKKTAILNKITVFGHIISIFILYLFRQRINDALKRHLKKCQTASKWKSSQCTYIKPLKQNKLENKRKEKKKNNIILIIKILLTLLE